jgi:hypothetical protein
LELSPELAAAGAKITKLGALLGSENCFELLRHFGLQFLDLLALVARQFEHVLNGWR